MAEQRKWDTWPAVVSSSKHVGQMLEWLRWKTGGKVQLVIAIGANSVAVARDDRMPVAELINALRAEQDTIADLLNYLQATNLPSVAKMRPDGR